MERDGTRVEEELGPVERARLLQNVVKLWIVKRLYEFVLFAQASRFFLLSFFFHSPLHSSPSVILSLSLPPPLPPSLFPLPESRSIATTILLDSKSIVPLLNTKREFLFRESTENSFLILFSDRENEDERRVFVRGNMDRILKILK